MNEGRSEFGFELRVCQWAERNWPPVGDGDQPAVVARQLGTARRRWDTIVIECDPEGLAQRAHFGERQLDSDLLDVIPHAPPEWAWYQDALPDPGYPWRYVREAIHRAGDRGILETRRRANRIEIRRKWPYPDWIERVVAIENKPDLDASAARQLAPQLHHDVALGLADEVWVATEATGESVEPILLEDLPVEAGVLTLDVETGAAEASWQPRTLTPDRPGTRILEHPSPNNHETHAARFEYADVDWKARKRLEIAERAYERGWRSYVDSMRPDCRHFELAGPESVEAAATDGGCTGEESAGEGYAGESSVGAGRTDGDLVPLCRARGILPTPSQCRHACPSFEPEPPTWRAKGWPIEGGPGKGIQHLLAERRRRRRPDQQ